MKQSTETKTTDNRGESNTVNNTTEQRSSDSSEVLTEVAEHKTARKARYHENPRGQAVMQRSTEATSVEQELSEATSYQPRTVKTIVKVRKTPQQIAAGERLTRKQKAFADYLLEHPQASASEAVRHAYKLSNPRSSTASTVATENMRKPSVQAYMQLHGDIASSAVVEVLQNSRDIALATGSASHAQVVLQGSKDVLDRLYGKPVVKTENVNLNATIQDVLF